MCETNEFKNITDSITRASQKILGDKLRMVILYGSYARKDYDAGSDIDIMIIADIPAEDIMQYQKSVSKVSGKLSLETTDCVTISALLQDNETFEAYNHVLPFFKNVLKDGVILYAA